MSHENWRRVRRAAASKSNGGIGFRPRNSTQARNRPCGKARPEGRGSLRHRTGSFRIETYAEKQTTSFHSAPTAPASGVPGWVKGWAAKHRKNRDWHIVTSGLLSEAGEPCPDAGPHSLALANQVLRFLLAYQGSLAPRTSICSIAGNSATFDICFFLTVSDITRIAFVHGISYWQDRDALPQLLDGLLRLVSLGEVKRDAEMTGCPEPLLRFFWLAHSLKSRGNLLAVLSRFCRYGEPTTYVSAPSRSEIRIHTSGDCRREDRPAPRTAPRGGRAGPFPGCRSGRSEDVQNVKKRAPTEAVRMYNRVVGQNGKTEFWT